MKAKTIVDNLRVLGRQDLNVVLTYLADHVYEARLTAGQRLTDIMDFKLWLRELATAARIPQSTEVSDDVDLRTRPMVTSRQFVGEFCPDCGHVHIDGSECGFPIGGGRVCRCERAAVPA